MNVHDPNLERVELVAIALGPLRDRAARNSRCFFDESLPT